MPDESSRGSAAISAAPAWVRSRPALNATVFVSGAAVLILEIAATRLLSPYFGSTLQTISSVITVVLGALSAGYYLGGRLADRHPTYPWFFGLICGSGISTLVLRVLAAWLLPAYGFDLPLDTGPLVMAPVLFFPPCFLLGLLSPYAVKLQSVERPAMGSGENAGSVFFWSTLGSICGSLSAGFVLVPALGLSRILLLTGLLLAVLGGAGLLLSGAPRSRSGFAALLVGLPLLVALPRYVEKPIKTEVYSKDGVYQRVWVFEAPYKDRPARYLFLDRSSAGIAFLDGDDLAYDYTRYYRLAEVFGGRLDRALVLGAGPFSVPKALLETDPHVVVDVVDIEPELLPVAERFFNLRRDPRLRNHVADARGFLIKSKTLYDLIFSDVYLAITMPTHLTTLEYFALLRDRLTPSGLVVANVRGDLHDRPPTFLGSMVRTFASAFPHSFVVTVEDVPPDRLQNFIFVGATHPLVVDPADPRLRDHPLAEIRRLPERLLATERLHLDRQILLTDEHAPSDQLTAQQVDREARAPVSGNTGG